MFTRFLSAVALAMLSVTGASAYDVPKDKSKVTLVFDQALPNVPGSHAVPTGVERGDTGG